MSKFSRAALLFAGAMSAAAPAGAQQWQAADTLGPPVVYAGVQGLYARPTGEFRNYVQHGGGLNLHVAWPVQAGSPFALRADGGFIVYGSETKEVCFSTTVGCRVRLNLTTTNTIAFLNAGPQLMVQGGPIRPYANAGIGFSYFATSSQVDGTGSNQQPFASTTNFDDFTLSWVGGGGVLIPVVRGITPVFLDMGVRYVGNGQVEYLKKGDIQDHPDGSITFTPTRSEANLLTFQVGVSVGVRRRQPQ
jgi:opacity protein-like surface antigen